MEYIEDWVDRALSCFYRERDKPTTEPNNNEPPDLIAEFSDEGKLQAAFEKFVAELGLTEEKRLELIGCTNEKKLALLVSKNGQLEEDVDDLLETLRQPSPDLSGLQHLVIALRTLRESRLASFLESSGLELICTSLSNCQNTSGTNSAAFLLLCAFRALLNSESGRQAVLGSDESLEAIARSIGFEDAKCKVAAVEVLSGLCFVDEGHQRVLTALTQVSEALCERTRFQHLVNDFHKRFVNVMTLYFFRFSTDRETDRVRTAILGLFNALLRNGPAENSVHFRAHIRFELLMLGIEKALGSAKESASSRLEDHIDLLEMMRKEDELTLSGSSEDSGSSSPVDFESVVGMAEALHEKLATSLAQPHFISLLQHLFMVPCDERHVPLWKLFDLILQQLTLQTTVDGITDVRKPITGIIDMADVLSRIQTQCDYERVERELEKVKEELEQEKLRNIELENRLADLNDGRSSVSSGISSLSSLPSDPCPSPIPVLPPVCAPMAPPPPPPLLGMKMAIQELQKKVPKPTQQLKSLNWCKLTSDKTKGTVWEHLDDEKMYKQLDLAEIEQTFASSSSHRDDDTETIYGTLQRRRETQISVIDSRRVQNCTIMLSKLKLTHKEIRSALLNMDEQCKLPKDMIEQMLKFVPTKEEVIAINEVVNRHKSPQILALADRYMYEVAQIPRFEQRLRCLHIIRTYKDRVDALLPGISAVHKASLAMTTCKRLRQYFALVLATGNYLNFGKRNGNAYGFDLNSLTRLTEVKYANRTDRNLVHYLLSWIDKKNPDMTKLKRDLFSVFEAARYNQADTQNEIRSLEQAIGIVRTELHFVTSQKNAEHVATTDADDNKMDKKDRFAAAAKQFITTANNDYSSLEKQFSEMKTKCVKMFCINPHSLPEEVFSTMSRFLNQLDECHQQQWQENEEIEKVKKQTIARSYFAKKNRRREKEKDFEQLISALQSGDIFKEDLSRLRTSFRVTKRTRAAKT